MSRSFLWAKNKKVSSRKLETRNHQLGEKKNTKENKQEIKGNEVETIVKYYFQKICTTNVFSVSQKAMSYKKTWAQRAPG